MADHSLDVIGLARDLSDQPDVDAFYAASLERLVALVPADHAFWTCTDFHRGTAEVRGSPGTDAALAEALGRFGPTHPAILTYIADPHDLRPRRMSDVADQRTWHGSPIYGEAFAQFGSAHQLSLVVEVSSTGTGAGWTLTRSGRDFSDAELDLADRVLPVLMALARVLPAHRSLHPSVDPPLSGRETEVLLGLAAGLTASTIGRRLGITERTVRKHLGAVYEKLACHDRLLAVQAARERGLLPG